MPSTDVMKDNYKLSCVPSSIANAAQRGGVIEKEYVKSGI